MFLHFLPIVAVLPISRTFAGLIQSEAVCAATFTWSQNSKSQSPCLVAAYVSGSCGTDTWNVPALTAGNHYDFPNATTATLCTCSWAAYNLLSACTACQGLDDSVPNWDAFIQGCAPGLLSNNTYFPATITLTSDTAIPYWAGTDPTTWPDHHFNVAQAQATAGQGHPDLGTSTAQPKKKKAPIGPIVGGVLGGVVVLAVVAVAIFCIVRRQRKLRGTDHGHKPEGIMKVGRSISILSQQSLGTPLGYAPQTLLDSGIVRSGTNPTSHGHSNSGHSASYFSSAHGSGQMSPSSPLGRQTASLATTPLSREEIIEPFFPGPQASPEVPVGGKRSATPAHPIYDAPSLLPAVIGLDGRALDSTPPRTRVNPPAYSASPGDGDTSASSEVTGDVSVGYGSPRRDKELIHSRLRSVDNVAGRVGGLGTGNNSETTSESSPNAPARPHAQNLGVANPDVNVMTRNDVA